MENEDIKLGVSIKNNDDKTLIISPPEGIATANNILGRRNSNNNIWIYGHSLYGGVPQTFNKLQDLNSGDKLMIDGDDLTRDRNLKDLEFEVEKRLLADMDSGHKLLFGERQNLPRLVIQTSVRETGSNYWIFGKDKIKQTTESILEGNEDDPSKYLLLFIIAKPTSETLSRLRANQ